MKTLKPDNSSPSASKDLAALFLENGQYQQAKKVLRDLIDTDVNDLESLEKLIKFALVSGRLRDAAKFAEEYAGHSCGYAEPTNGKSDDNVQTTTPISVTAQKLRHDLLQFLYLKQMGIKIEGLEQLINNYTKVLEGILSPGTEKILLSKAQSDLIRPAFKRILYRPHTPRVRRALSDKWDVVSAGSDGISAENDYINSQIGITIIDNFLSDKALSALRKFCLESTVWFRDKYAYGRLGAFFREGFNCPLLIQIGEEIKAAFPHIIGEQHVLNQIWAFKFDHFQPVTRPHGDFAAVNVNFWITADEANLDVNSGGMVIYDVEAPLSWDFDSYNNQGEKIVTFLKQQQAGAATIPYKANRAIIFNSNLFHATSPIQFKDTYDCRRINVTMLYGKRENK